MVNSKFELYTSSQKLKTTYNIFHQKNLFIKIADQNYMDFFTADLM